MAPAQDATDAADLADKTAHLNKLLDLDALLDEPALRLEASSGVPPPFRSAVWPQLLHVDRAAPLSPHASFAALAAAFDRDGPLAMQMRAALRAAPASAGIEAARSPATIRRFLCVVGAHVASTSGSAWEPRASSASGRDAVRDMVRVAAPILRAFPAGTGDVPTAAAAAAAVAADGGGGARDAAAENGNSVADVGFGSGLAGLDAGRGSGLAGLDKKRGADADAYAVFSTVMRRAGSFYRRDTLDSAVRDFLMLFKAMVPELHDQFVDADFDVSVWAPSAMRSLLSAQLPAASASRLIDAYVARGEADWAPFHVHVCVALLAILHEREVLADVEPESLLPRLSSLPANVPIDRVVNRAVTYEQDSAADGFVPAAASLPDAAPHRSRWAVV